MVTHDAHAASIADRVLFLKDGMIVHDHGAMHSDDIYDVVRSLETICPADDPDCDADEAQAGIRRPVS